MGSRPLASDEIRLSGVALRIGRWEGAEEVLDAAERTRAQRFVFEGDRQDFIRSHAALRQIIGAALGREPQSLAFAEGEHGRPELEDRALSFNLSHSAGRAVVALSNRRIGVDLEELRGGSGDSVSTLFSEVEKTLLTGLPAELQQRAFFQMWVRKEAWLKANGRGLTVPLDSFDVSADPREPASLIACRPDPLEAARWRLLDLPAPEGWCSALAVEAGPTRLMWDRRD